MVRTVEKPGGPARVETIVTPPKEGMSMAGLSVPVRLVRIGYAVLSSVFVVCVLVQVFFAEMGAFGADWSWHLTFAHFLGLLPLLMAPTAFAGRLSWGLSLLPLGLLVLIGVQYAFANAAVPAAALHPVNALLILLLSLLAARRAWSAVAGRRKG
jgi:mercuric ion transport protein